jgi:pimeloyl-ACP methyl ester carboxylesterase
MQSYLNEGFIMPLSTLIIAPLALCGVAALALAAALATPLSEPTPLASVHQGAMRIGDHGKPELTRFQARDGTWLAYRYYAPAEGEPKRIAILEHGSSASSDEMNEVALALAHAGIASVAVDNRGHGASGTRGDIGYIGQLDDDLEDLVTMLKAAHPSAELELIGHSAGGGFVSRIAAGPLRDRFARFVLLAPYLGYFAPTNRPNEGAGQWVGVAMPRVLALRLLGRLGVDWGQSLPALAFAVRPEARPYVTPSYSYRLMSNYTGPDDWRASFVASRGKMIVIAGEADELMNSPAYASALEPLGARVETLPNVDHMGVVYQPAALQAIVAAVAS